MDGTDAQRHNSSTTITSKASVAPRLQGPQILEGPDKLLASAPSRYSRLPPQVCRDRWEAAHGRVMYQNRDKEVLLV